MTGGYRIFEPLDVQKLQQIRANQYGVYLLKAVNKKAIAFLLLLDAQSRITQCGIERFTTSRQGGIIFSVPKLNLTSKASIRSTQLNN
jgi:hypothetical protein